MSDKNGESCLEKPAIHLFPASFRKKFVYSSCGSEMIMSEEKVSAS